MDLDDDSGEYDRVATTVRHAVCWEMLLWARDYYDRGEDYIGDAITETARKIGAEIRAKPAALPSPTRKTLPDQD